MTVLFWQIIGAGLFFPGLLILLATLFSSFSIKGYEVSMGRLGIIYVATLLGAAMLWGLEVSA
ncbi:hypothetical protein D3C77_517620 [compost metagenome]